jgi:hypothetical protein
MLPRFAFHIEEQIRAFGWSDAIAPRESRSILHSVELAFDNKPFVLHFISDPLLESEADVRASSSHLSGLKSFLLQSSITRIKLFRSICSFYC